MVGLHIQTRLVWDAVQELKWDLGRQTVRQGMLLQSAEGNTSKVRTHTNHTFFTLEWEVTSTYGGYHMLEQYEA